ncbi:MAG TPA: hypothetical protein DEA97_07605 [Bacteroidales bacterium]|nr:MAG: hypothetical protein A2281_10920 [Bacteroidetes bacterium RIFOXYA12_FULL_38_20]HBS86406.1 hypothetical protein [Bacteroidales bacterium]
MKKMLFTICVLFFFSTENNAQTYFPTLGNSNEWYVLHSFEGSYTTINYTEGLYSNGEFEYKVYKNNGMIFGYTREDSINNKVYFKYTLNPDHLAYDTTDVLINDFSMNVGDSMLYKLKTYELWLYVDSIKTALILEGERKIFYLHTQPDGIYGVYYPVWIEGVGSLAGFEYPQSTPDDFGASQVNCFFRNDIHVYQSEMSFSYGTCDIELSNNENSKNEYLISTYPNPCIDIINIDINGIKNPRLNIYNLCHQKIMSKELFIGRNQLNLEGLDSGAYFFEISNEHLLVSKLVIIK